MKRNTVIVVGGIVLASEIIWQLYKWLRTRGSPCTIHKSNVNKFKENISEVMFFSRDSSLCRSHANNANDKDSCDKYNCAARYVRTLTNYIDRAEQSLDVCMYTLTCQSLSRAIVNAHRRGILVRIIMDRGMACNEAAQTALFHNSGVALRLQESDVLMHHKFVIVDRCILINGSTNWTMSAFFGNFENTIVTNESSLVQPFVDEFEKLWILFENPICSESKLNFESDLNVSQ